MKKYIVFAIFILLSACNPVWEDVADSIGSKNGHSEISRNNQTITTDVMTVTAERALRLRSYPEGFGGYELTTMPNHSEFHVYYCEDFSGTIWAYGSYTDDQGKNWLGYAAARYLSGGCDE